MQTAVITGVSSGIGYATAKELIANGYKVFGSVRNKADAERLQQELGNNYIPLLFDITDEEAVHKAALFVREQLQGETLTTLINNAGIAVAGPLMELPLSEIRRQLDVNVFGHVHVTQEFVPLLGADKTLSGNPGKIINIGSASGQVCSPFLGAYSMSKHCMEAFSDTLRMELMLYGIDVILIGPGPIITPIWDKAKEEIEEEELKKSAYAKPLEKFRHYVYNVALKRAYPMEKIAHLILHILSISNPKPRYAPVPNKFVNWILPHIMSTRMRHSILARHLGLQKQGK